MRAVLAAAPLACVFGLLFAVPTFAQKLSFSGDLHQVETDVLAQLNIARTRPTTYVETLMNYRGYFKANLVVMPGKNLDVETQEGTVPVDEAVEFLQTHPALQALQMSDLLTKAAAAHVAEQARTGGTGHYSADGASPGDRTAKIGGGKAVAEVIAYGAADAEDVIRQLIIDDGVADRGHRVVMFSDHLRYAGVACGPHPEFGTMCVVDMADTPDAQLRASPSRHVSVAAMDSIRPRRP